jgi:transcriptional regulator with XRE-family HTH domain
VPAPRPVDPLPALSKNLASNLRYLRERRRLTQAMLAKSSGVPRSTIAALETGSGNPTVAVLARLGAALGVSIEEILSAPHASGRLYRRGSLPVDRRGRRTAAELQRVLPEPLPGITLDRLVLAPGARLEGAPHRPGSRGFVSCERGGLQLWAAGERFDLEPWDVVAFQADQPHSYANAGLTTAVGMSFIVLAPPGWRPPS